MMFLNQHGLTTQKFLELNIGPILLREEAVFRREIRFEDEITVDLSLLKAKADYSRWSFKHQFIKHDGMLAATITIDGAWIDTVKRKFALPDVFIKNIFDQIARTPDFISI
jgi:acyl-CoA thioester hydrolase